MKATILFTAFASLTALVLAQNDIAIPACAQGCLTQAIGNTTCGITDYYCQCTSGASKILDITLSCLCDSTCGSNDLIQLYQATNQICTSALSAKGQTYTASQVGLAGHCTTGSSDAATAAATTTTTGTATHTATGRPSSASATAMGSTTGTASAASSTSSSGAAGGRIGGLAEGALAGVFGLAVLAL